jgi:hypothetical protein
MPRLHKLASPFRHFNPSLEVTRWRRISPANVGPNRFHQNLTVSWQVSIPLLAKAVIWAGLLEC